MTDVILSIDHLNIKIKVGRRRQKKFIQSYPQHKGGSHTVAIGKQSPTLRMNGLLPKNNNSFLIGKYYLL